MKRHLFSFLILLITTAPILLFNSCAEYVPGDLNNLQGKGTIEIKILSGPEKDKVYKSSGYGAVMGTKRTQDGQFVVYQIVGTYQNIGFTGQVSNEDGKENFTDRAIGFNTSMSDIYTSVEDPSNEITITDIVLTQSYDQVGAQIMNGKLTFKGKFIKENLGSNGNAEEEMLVEGTVTF